VRDLAGKVLDGTLVLSGPVLNHLSDGEVETRLRAPREIRPWTAQVFMILRMGSLDIWPTADIDVRRGFALGWAVPMPTSMQLDRLGGAVPIGPSLPDTAGRQPNCTSTPGRSMRLPARVAAQKPPRPGQVEKAKCR
jgi:hypothetical protein